jgi:hypothetical protein
MKIRENFYKAVTLAQKQAVLSTKSECEKRKLDREAIFKTMESFKLIKRTRGGQELCSNPEEIT